MDVRARKRAIRVEVVDRILAMSAADRRGQEAALAARLESLPGFASARSVLLYATGFPEEIDTGPMLRRSLALGKRLILPTVDRRSRSLRLSRVEDLDRDLVPSPRGIPEPLLACPEIGSADVDWVLVPGLAFDDRGYRLGRGAGHYDRLIPTLRPGVACWALILDAQWRDDLPIEPHDRPVSGVADHSVTVTFGGAS